MPAPRRIERVSREMVRILSKVILYELNDPRMSLAAVTRAKLTPDLSEAKVYISVLGEEKQKTLVMHGLNHAKGFIQRALGEQLKIRIVPRIQFVLDDSIEKGIRMEKLIDKITSEEEE